PRHQLLRILADDDDEAPQARRPRVLDEFEPPRRRRREDGGGPVPERSRDGPLVAGRDLELAQRQALASLGKGPRRRRQPFSLVQRPPKRSRPSLGDTGL